MKPIFKLTPEEKEIDRAIEAGEYKPIKNMKAEIKRIQKIAQNQFKDRMVSFRVNGLQIEEFKSKAKEKGIPYQTLLSAFVKQYNEGKATISL